MTLKEEPNRQGGSTETSKRGKTPGLSGGCVFLLLFLLLFSFSPPPLYLLSVSLLLVAGVAADATASSGSTNS